MAVTSNVFAVLERTARGPRRDDVALHFEGVDRSFTALHEQALAFAAGLEAEGVAAGDRVAVLLGNGHEWPEVLFGLAALGAICVPVNVLLASAEVAHVLGDSRSSCLVVDAGAQRALAGLELPRLVVTVGDVELTAARRVDYAALLAGGAGRPSPAPPSLDELAILYYSSGTTGLPKAAAHTANGVLWNSFAQVLDLGLTPDDTYLVVPSFSWAAGFHNLVLALIWIGGRSVIMPTGATSLEQIVATTERTGATHAMLVPTLLRGLLAEPALLERLRASTLRWVVSGAEPVPKSVIEAINAELPGTDIVQGYGLSEFPTIATLLRSEEALTHAGSAGRTLTHTDMAVQRDDGAIVPSGSGEVLLRSPATMHEYFGRAEETAAAFADGWLHTGDLGTIDEAGYLTITGRKKDMIISGGLNVYPKEVEEVIYRLPGVREASVVGVPDERWGEATVAVVVADASLDPDDVARLCREQLASYKRPRVVLMREEPLPRTSTGKILKRELRPWAAERLGLIPVT